VKRRTVLQLAGVMLIAPRMLFAQATRRHRLGLLAVSDESTTELLFLDPFLAGMRARGGSRPGPRSGAA
jgi:hypothetical protein